MNYFLYNFFSINKITAVSKVQDCWADLPLKELLTPSSPLLIPGILTVANTRPKITYEHQCSFHWQCKSDLAIFSLVKQCETVAPAWNSCEIWTIQMNEFWGKLINKEIVFFPQFSVMIEGRRSISCDTLLFPNGARLSDCHS